LIENNPRKTSTANGLPLFDEDHFLVPKSKTTHIAAQGWKKKKGAMSALIFMEVGCAWCAVNVAMVLR
jgi:hypothetical protein